jgi:hypothetical protein
LKSGKQIPERERMNDEAVLIDQAQSREGLNKPHTTVDDDVFAGLSLQARDLVGNVAARDP